MMRIIIPLHCIFSDAKDYVDTLPRIPNDKEARSDIKNHGKFSGMFRKKVGTKVIEDGSCR